MRRAGLHRLHARRRLRHARRRRRAPSAFPLDGLRRPGRGRAAALRRPDRLALAAHGGRRRARLGLYGFGAAAHIVAQVARWQGRDVYAFTRPGDERGPGASRARSARVWAGGSDELPPEPLDAAIIFAPVGALVPAALAAVRKGGRVVCGGIHMSDIPAFPYALLWEERRARARSPT